MVSPRITPRASGAGRVRRRALVTGGASESGKRSPCRWRGGDGCGHRISPLGRAARRAAAEIGALGGRVTTIHANLADPAEARRLVQRAARALGGLDLLVNSAAIFERTPFATTTAARYDRLLGLNLRALFSALRRPPR